MGELKYRKAFDTLRSEILSGKYASRKSFPSIVATCSRFKISRLTAVKALDKLKDEGLISTRVGAGTFVTKDARSRFIGLVVPGISYSSEFFQPIIAEFVRVARSQDYTIVMDGVWSPKSDDNGREAIEVAARLIRRRVAGVIYQPLEYSENSEAINRRILSAFSRAGIPVVLLDGDIVPGPKRSDYDLVSIDNVAAGEAVAAHLMECGARNIRFLMRANWVENVRNRARGVRNEVLANGLRWSSKSVVTADPADASAVAKLMKSAPRPDAFVCASAYLLRLTGALMAQGDEDVARYGDLMERTLYNGFFAAQSEDGLKYRYWSPFNETADWYPRDTYCCPNNFRRMVFEIPDLVYFRAADGLYVNLYAPSELKADGLHVVQRTGYPADGRVAFEFDFARSQRVRFRIPGWTGSSEGWRQVEFPSGRSRYELDFEMRPRLIRGVRAQAGNAALMIGPVVYGLRNDSRVPPFHHWCEAGGFAPDQPFALSNGVVRVTLEKSYVPGIVRERRTFDFVPFCASDRVRTYFRADSRQKLVDDELYADWAREVLKCGKTGGAK